MNFILVAGSQDLVESDLKKYFNEQSIIALKFFDAKFFLLILILWLFLIKLFLKKIHLANVPRVISGDKKSRLYLV